jgi:polysaccharide biosynthesis/export protein
MKSWQSTHKLSTHRLLTHRLLTHRLLTHRLLTHRLKRPSLLFAGLGLAWVMGAGGRAIAAEPLSLPALPPPANSAPVAVPASVARLSDTYVLGPGDAIAISIFNVPEYSGSQQVSADGSLNLPVVGVVNVSGLTLQQAGQVISVAYDSELRYPQVTVVLEKPRPLRIAVSGEVSQPGLYTLAPEGDAQFPTVAQALQTAGGVTQAADLRNVQLRRAASGGATQSVTLDLWQLLNNGDVRQDLALRDGDAIVIGETRAVDIAETNRLSASNLASNAQQPITVAVVGEVFRPGAYEFNAAEATTGRTTLTQVVQQAGGLKPSADIRQVQVRRLTRSGAEQLIDLDLWQLLNDGDISQDLVLQQSDTVIIPMAAEPLPSEIAQLTAANLSPSEVNINVVGEVARPGAIKVPPATTLNQAVLAAGGFNQRSNETVELLRLNPNGTVTQRQVDVALGEGMDAETNPLILNNDVIIVGRNGRARFGDTVQSIFGPVLQLLNPLRLLF